jgi:hypothetical protein
MANDVAIRQQGGAVATRQEAGPMTLTQGRGIIELATSAAVIHQLIKAIMVGPCEKHPMGIHYGKIPGTPKPTLYKAGAEKILATFRIATDFEVTDLSTDDCIRYRVKVIGILPDGSIIGYGIGECSSDEEKYRWKKPACDTEYDETDPARRRLKWGKGSNGKADYSTKQIRTNPADLGNTILKMGKKRGVIDMVLTSTAASDVFDQDLEDLSGVIDITDYQQVSGKPEVRPPAAASQQQTQGGEQGAGDKDPAAKIAGGGAAYLVKQLDAKKIPYADFCTHMKVDAIADITNAKFNEACGVIKRWEAIP